MRRRLAAIPLAALALLAVGRAVAMPVPPGAPVAGPGATPVASPVATPVGPIADAASLAAALAAGGLAVEPLGPVSQPFLQAEGEVLLLSGGGLAGPAEVQAYAYPDAVAAAADAAQIGPGGQPATVSVAWLAPPHFFRQGPLLVLYVGDDPAVLALLTELLGPPFAGP